MSISMLFVELYLDVSLEVLLVVRFEFLSVKISKEDSLKNIRMINLYKTEISNFSQLIKKQLESLSH